MEAAAIAMAADQTAEMAEAAAAAAPMFTATGDHEYVAQYIV